MEVVVDVNFTYSAPGVDQLVKSMDLMTKFKGDNSENFSYIQQVTNSEVQADAQWSGIQDGVTFTVKNKSFSGVKEAAELLLKMVESVLDTVKSNLSDMKIPSSAMNEAHGITSVKCGVCNRTHQSSLQAFEKHVDSHDTTPQDIDINEIVKNLSKSDSADSSLSVGADSKYRPLPFGSKGTKTEHEESKSFDLGGYSSSRKGPSQWDTLWDSDKLGSTFKSGSKDRRSRSRSRERDVNRSRARDRYGNTEISPTKKRTHSPTYSYDKKRKYGNADFCDERLHPQMDSSQNFLYNDVSDEMIENSSPVEPPYVAKARLEILSEQRSFGKLRDEECRMLVDNFLWSLSQIDKAFISGLIQSEERACRDRGMRLAKSDILTIQMKAVCKFFISRSEQGNSDSIDKYPYAQQMKLGNGNYTRTRSVKIPPKGPKSKAQAAEKPKHDDKRGLSEDEILNPQSGEPLYKSLRRRTILEQERLEGKLSDARMREYVFKLRAIGNEPKQKVFTGRRIEKMNIPSFARPTQSQRLEAELFGLCDMIVESNQAGEEVSKMSTNKSSLEFPKKDQDISWSRDNNVQKTSASATASASSLPPWLVKPGRETTPSVNHPLNGAAVRPLIPATPEMRSLIEPSPAVLPLLPSASTTKVAGAGSVGTTHRIMMKPHPAEPEYISQGRFKKMMADRRSENLDDRKLEAVLKEMRDSIPEEHKARISQTLNEEMRRVGMSFMSLSKTEQLDALLKNTCLYFLKRSLQERQAAGPYPMAHLLSQVDDVHFQQVTAATFIKPQQRVEKTDEFSYSDLSDFFIMNPCSSEPELVSKARFKKLESHFKFSTYSGNLEEAANIARDIKSVLSQKEKDSISQAFTRALQQSHHGGSGSSEALQLKAICEYFLKLTSAERQRNEPYPHMHLLNKLIRNKPDSQLRGTSRNGQYSMRYAEFFKKLDVVKKIIRILADQNNVTCEFNVTTTPKSQYQASVTIGWTEFKETSAISSIQATSMAIYQALMKTEYGFYKLPYELKGHTPNKAANKVLVRSADPIKSARMMLKVLERQTNKTMSYTVKNEFFCFAVGGHFGNETYTGIGITEDAAKSMADFYCVQQTNYPFQEVPPGIAIGYQGERFRVVEEPYGTVVSRRRDFQDGNDTTMTDEFTWLVISEVEQKAKLSSKDVGLINKKIEIFSLRAPKTAELKTVLVTKKLEYTCDLATKRENQRNFQVANWLEEAKSEPHFMTGAAQKVGVPRLPWIPQLEPSVDILRAPVQERYSAMKSRMSELMIKRKRDTLHDEKASAMINAMRKLLPTNMMFEVDQRLDKAHKTISNQAMDNPRSMIATMKLSVLTHYLLEQLEKQMNAGGNNRPAMPAMTPYNRFSGY